MKLFLISLISFTSFGQILSTDKTSHYIAGGLAGYYGASLELSMTSNVHPYLTCVGSALLVGTAKELMDRPTTGFDKKDLGYTVIGGVVSGTIIYFIKRRKLKRLSR